ncbi:TrkH family potassium uptake protein [Methanobacterium sp. CWC-01]|uniref:TrkH family potassium uptake protein n=1 Tax=Methanobacterium aridiramus TaxID=2584467 RepID=UPI002576B8E2|nr:TrkH family potassium uptake protein [Methanobacterium sp. CWC-01]WJI09638.1 TrkH family potassium uptake protein [Methanobacterium sp. CWC-01]
MIGQLRRRDLLLIAHPLGMIMQGTGVVVLLPLITALVYNESTYLAFIIPSILSLALGYLLKMRSSQDDKLGLKHGMIIAAVAWLWAALIGSLCLVMGTHIDFLNAFFESMSAWTGSGLSIFTNVEILPKSILFLRSLEQWVGGLGVIIVIIGILIRPGTAAARLYKSEAREEKIKPSITGTVKTIWWIYLFYTVVGILLYIAAGMPIFDAINNTFTNLSTGGMSVKNDNIGAYHSLAIYIITMILMVIGGTSFLVHYKALKGRAIDVLRDIQFQTTIIMIALFSILLIVGTKFATIDAVFFVISALSCTGSNIQPVNVMVNWPDYAKIIITACMIIGMSAGSTTGALKLIRIITLVKGIYWEILRIVSPAGSVIPRKISGKAVGDEEIREAGGYLFLYFIFLFASWLVLMQYGYGGINSIFEVASAQGNVGLSTGIVAPTMPPLTEIFLIINMWVGRIEIIPVLVLLKLFVDLFKR